MKNLVAATTGPDRLGCSMTAFSDKEGLGCVDIWLSEC